MLRAPLQSPLSSAFKLTVVPSPLRQTGRTCLSQQQKQQQRQLLHDRRNSHAAASSRSTQIEASEESPTSAYVHLPFCKRRCFYCDFPVSVVGSKPEQPGIQQGMQEYVNLLCKEINSTVNLNGPPLKTVFFGGGTPTLIPPRMLQQLLDAISSKYGIAAQAEISMESDPGTFDVSRLQQYMSLGVNRFSMGVQCFQQDLLQLCGRSHSLDDIYRAIDDVHQAGAQNWSLDLISGLPQLTNQHWQHSLQEAIRADPSHISVYDLQVEAKTPFARWYEPGSHPLPTDDATADMYRTASSMLSQAGYEHYEISNYAKAGHRSQHNLGYWNNRPFYAFGVGAASYLFERRFSRPRTMKAYQQWVSEFAGNSKAGQMPGFDIMEPEALQEQLLDYVMLRLRLADGIPMDELHRKFGRQPADIIQSTLLGKFAGAEKYACEVLIQGQRHIRLTDPEGFLMSNDCIATLFAKLDDLDCDAEADIGRAPQLSASM